MGIKLKLGTSQEAIDEASRILGVTFPRILEEIWLTSNGLELPGGYRLYPVFDRNNPRKSWGHIVYENTQGRWSYMPKDLISIAGGDTGNRLVLKKDIDILGTDVYIWNHETNKIKRRTKGLEDILAKAKKRVEKIENKILKSRMKKR